MCAVLTVSSGWSSRPLCAVFAVSPGWTWLSILTISTIASIGTGRSLSTGLAIAAVTTGHPIFARRSHDTRLPTQGLPTVGCVNGAVSVLILQLIDRCRTKHNPQTICACEFAIAILVFEPIEAVCALFDWCTGVTGVAFEEQPNSDNRQSRSHLSEWPKYPPDAGLVEWPPSHHFIYRCTTSVDQ